MLYLGHCGLRPAPRPTLEIGSCPHGCGPSASCTTIALFGPHDNIFLPFKIARAWVLSLLLAILYANVREAGSNWMHRIFHWIAEHSYGIYLSHNIVFWIVFYRMAMFPFWLRIASLMAGTIGIPALLYVSVERPLILAGAHFADGSRRSADSSAASPINQARVRS